MEHTNGARSAGAPSAGAEPATAVAEVDRWPWECLYCGSVLYHDVELCRDCGPSPWADETPGGSRSLLARIREQAVPTFGLKAALVAGVELALAAVWIRMAVPPP